MWEAAFDPSMLKSPVIIHCPDNSDVQNLMAILRENGVKWCTGEAPTMGGDCWEVEKENTVYYIEEGKIMTFGSKKLASNGDYIRCTFVHEAPDFDTANDEELITLLGIGGGQ